jgi:hypothetical protein
VEQKLVRTYVAGDEHERRPAGEEEEQGDGSHATMGGRALARVVTMTTPADPVDVRCA